MALAASSPTRMPCRTCAPSPICASESAYFASITPRWLGKSAKSVVCAAAAAAASGDALRGACSTRYGAWPPTIAFTASYIARCTIAMLRVGWTVAGCAPGVWRICSSVPFHWMT